LPWEFIVTEKTPAPRAPSSKRLEPLRTVDAGVLNIAYYEAGPADGPAVMLMHGFPYDIHSYVDVAPQLAAQGCRVIVPYLRVNSYLIQDIARAMVPARPEREVPLWYQYYFQLERGRAGLAANRRGITKILWEQWSPNWPFDEACLDRTAVAHDNPDYVDVVIHSYRHRYGLADSDPRYADIQQRLAALPPITVPAITLDGDGDGVSPATDGRSSAARFTGRRVHRVVPRAGHNLPQEEPEAFAAAVMELIKA
jgi:pimeloyl-ACP methyl ester carboxylesterase